MIMLTLASVSGNCIPNECLKLANITDQTKYRRENMYLEVRAVKILQDKVSTLLAIS